MIGIILFEGGENMASITHETLQTATVADLVQIDWAALATSDQALHRAARRQLTRLLNQPEATGNHVPYHPPRKKIFTPDSLIH